MPCDARGAIDGALNDLAWIGLVNGFVPPGVGRGPGVEKGTRGLYKRIVSRTVNAQVAGKQR